ncbi:MAG: formimidoylglutamase [Parashewanella sp.]
MDWFRPYNKVQLKKVTQTRTGETRIGDHCYALESNHELSNLKQLAEQGVKFAVLGINEDLGPRGNLGRGGSGDGFHAAIEQLANFQSNQYLSGSEIIILGDIDTSDLSANQSDDINHIRQQVADIDARVVEVISQVIAAGLEPIVIGGGHNNAYGILKACSLVLKQPMAAVNLDPHSDFRLKEGRHSGNGFSYAASEGYLGFYHVLGLHELKNSAANLKQLNEFGASWHSLQQIWIRREVELTEALTQINYKVMQSTLPLGIELDVDAIANFPSSAMTTAGIPLMDAAHYIHFMAKNAQCRYLHLAEPAPVCHPLSAEIGYKQVGQSLAELIYAYIQGRFS